MANETEKTQSTPSVRPGWWTLAGLGVALAWLFGTPKGEPTRPTVHYEVSDLSARTVVLVGASVLAFTWISVALLYFLFEHFVDIHNEPVSAAQARAAQYVHLPPEPRLQQSPARDLREFNAEADKQLNSYQWIDRGKGVVSIPIERAIEIVATRGIPPVQPSANTYAVPQAGYPLTGFEGKVEPEPR